MNCISLECPNEGTLSVVIVGKEEPVCSEHARGMRVVRDNVIDLANERDLSPLLEASIAIVQARKAAPLATTGEDVLDALARHCAIARTPWPEDARAARRKTLGSSEIGAVCGVNPYATMHAVWLSKVHGVEFEGNESTLLGQLLEPAVVAIYCDRYDRKVTKGVYTVGPEPWMSATPDYRIVGGGLVEAKLVGFRVLWQWGYGNTDAGESDAIPLQYLAQCQWQMLVTGEPFVHLSALLGTEFRSYTIHANADVQRGLVDRGRDFWQRYVVTGAEPPADGSDSAAAMLKHLYPRSDGEMVRAADVPELETLAADLLAAREVFALAKSAKQETENKFKQRLRDARGAFGNEWRVRYATTKSGTRPFVFEHEKERETA